MEQNANNANQNPSFFEKNQVSVLVAVAIIIIGAIIFFSTRGDQSQNQNIDDQNNEQTAGENTNNDNSNNQNEGNNSNTPTPNPSTSVGNVSATGILRTSDIPSRGNLMVDSNVGKIYIATSRNFSSLIDKQVTLQANGSINQFTFLGFSEGSSVMPTPSPTPAPSDRNVSFSGRLQSSDDTSKGNYVITSGATKVYLKSVHDYSGLIGSDVNLSATGSINSFTNAVVTRK